MSSYHLFKKMRNIRSAAYQMNPDADWVASTRKTLLMQAKNSFPSVQQPRITVFQQTVRFLIPRVSLRWMRAPAFTVIAILLTVLGGSLYSVSAAENSLPGDFLYSIKLATEQARMALVNKPEDRVKLKTEFTGRRVKEMKQVIANSESDRTQRVTQAADILKRDLNTIKKQLDEVKDSASPETVKETVKMVDEKSKAVVKDLQESKSQLSTEEKLKVTEAQAAASDTSVKAIEVLVETHGKAADVVSEEDVVEALKIHSEDMKQAIAVSAEGHAVLGNESDSAAVLTTSTVSAASSTLSVPATDASSTAAVPETSADPILQQITEATKSLDDADKFVEEKNLTEAVASIRIGTQKAYAAQKTAEESVFADQAGATQTETASGDQNAPTDGAAPTDAPAGSDSVSASSTTSTAGTTSDTPPPPENPASVSP